MTAAGRPAPQRTCVGCRARASAADLLRVVAIDGRCVPDHRRRLPGRGAHLHRDLECLHLAERRRAFPRALRLVGPLDTTALREHLMQAVTRPHSANGTDSANATDSANGTHGEDTDG